MPYIKLKVYGQTILLDGGTWPEWGGGGGGGHGRIPPPTPGSASGQDKTQNGVVLSNVHKIAGS